MAGLERMDPFLPAADAERIERLGQGAGPYRMYVQAPAQEGLGAGLVRRHDAVKAHLERALAAGGPIEPMDVLYARTNLFRGIWAEGDAVHLAGCEELLHHDRLVAGARAISGKPLVRPTMLYANLLLPGQELALHTDTPHYRGIDKSTHPEWLLVVMAHSGLFERWRVAVAAALAFLGGCERGGELIVYADGPDREPTAIPARHDTAVAIDADGLFHGVARVGGPDAPAPPVVSGAELRFDDATGSWGLFEAGGTEPTATYARGELRFSLQWKALCFDDEADARRLDAGDDALDEARVLATLREDLCRRGRLPEDPAAAPPPDGTEFALALIDEYVRFPD